MYIDYTLNEMIQSVWVIFNILLFFFCSNLWYVCAGPLLLSPFWRKWVCHGLLNPHYFACTMFTFIFDAHKVNIDNIDRIDWTYWIETTKISDLSERSQNTHTHTAALTEQTIFGWGDIDRLIDSMIVYSSWNENQLKKNYIDKKNSIMMQIFPYIRVHVNLLTH